MMAERTLSSLNGKSSGTNVALAKSKLINHISMSSWKILVPANQDCLVVMPENLASGFPFIFIVL